VSQLEGAQVVVTGAAGGIGSLVAAGLALRGAIVTGIDRADCAACRRTIQTDLADPPALDLVVRELGQRRVDVLVNLAGMQYFGPLAHQEPESLRLGYAVNLVAPATLIHAVLPRMQARGSGHIVNIGSVMGAIAYPHFAAYSSAKAGLRALSEALRREVQCDGIHVTHIAPRAVRTGFNTATVNRFFDLVGMKADDPAHVAGRIVSAIAERRRELVIGVPERLFIGVNALLPSLIDRGLAGQTAKARMLFS
jgi:short-subunit dehydrogenase